jgi:hypothetical protein
MLGQGMSAAQPSTAGAAAVHPIVPHVRPCIGASDRERIVGLASKILLADPQICATKLFGPRVEAGLSDGPTLHIHDTGRRSVDGLVFGREHRALLLAKDGDVIAMSRPPVRAFQDHCRDDLGLGGPSVFVPGGTDRPMALSLRCASDSDVVARLSGIARAHGHLNVAPYIATGRVWALAGLVAQESGARLHVAGPPAGLCRRVNNKIWFARQASELLGRDAVPHTRSARGWAVLAHTVRRCARQYPSVGIKLPSESGASGNFVVDSEVVRRLPSLRAVDLELRRLLRHLGWDHPFPMLVSVWEESVIVTPSVQLWIPLRGRGEPIVEGVFEQRVTPEVGKFVGCAPSSLSQDLTERLASEAAMLGALFQELGYFGRCSLDSILVGDDLSSAEVHWIECNGRWGGTSIPMTLANRLVGDWTRRPFVVIGNVRGEAASTLKEIREAASSAIFDRARGTGVVFLSPAPAETGTGIDIMAVGASLKDANRVASEAIDTISRIGAERRH